MLADDMDNLRQKLIQYETHPPPSPFHQNAAALSPHQSANHSMNSNDGHYTSIAEHTEMEVSLVWVKCILISILVQQ